MISVLRHIPIAIVTLNGRNGQEDEGITRTRLRLGFEEGQVMQVHPLVATESIKHIKIHTVIGEARVVWEIGTR